MKVPSPTVVVVAYRSDDYLARALDGLVGELDVVVVDNAALDSTRRLSEEMGAAYVSVPSNPGFASAVNLGLQRTVGRDVLLLNPDARISADGVLALQRALRDPARHLAAVGPLLADDDGRPEPPDWPLPSPLQVWADAIGLGDRHRGRRFVTGAVLMLRAEALVEVGGFDERYFLYAEEADWQRRAQDAGWQVAVVRSVTAHHTGGATSDDSTVRDTHFYRSARAYARRWYGLPGAAVMRSGSVVAALRRFATSTDRGAALRALRLQLGASVEPTGSRRRSVVHVVRSDSFAGVERSIVDVATEQHRRGWRVAVVGGDSVRMRAELPAGVTTYAANSTIRAVRALRQAGPSDVVHAHMTAAELAATLARRRGTRVVVTRHFAATRGASLPVRRAAAWWSRRIDAQVSISNFVADSIESRSSVVHNGVPAAGPPRQRSRTVVVLQRLEPEKQTEVALRAWQQSHLAEDGWRLVVHGRGSDLAALHRLAEDLGCTASVDFAGFTDDPRAVLASAGVLIATAPAEPFGLTVAEAMAEGTPIVAADGGAHRELLDDLGAYFDPADAKAAAQQLGHLARKSAAETALLHEQLRERHRRLFGIEQQVDGLLTHYDAGSTAEPIRVAVLSLEDWDGVWRRNQHLASRVVTSNEVSSLLFVTPPRRGLTVRAKWSRPLPDVEVVTPPLLLPRRMGGHRLIGHWLRRATADADLVWVNDPVAGAAALAGRPAVYDVTDDWRSLDQRSVDRARIVKAEDLLVGSATTVVCSPTLAERWRERYGVEAILIGNGVDVAAIRSSKPVLIEAPRPHLIYVGTAHPSRIDVPLLLRLAEEVPGTLHLVGPESLDHETRQRLSMFGAVLHGAVPSAQVGSWLQTADVLICPHIVNAFTLSLDAIKAYEYLATGAPVVATPSSGFQRLAAPGLSVVEAHDFVAAVRAALDTPREEREAPADWADRAAEFLKVLAVVSAP